MIFAVFNYQASQKVSIHNKLHVMAFRTIQDAEDFFRVAGTGKYAFSTYIDVYERMTFRIRRGEYSGIREDEYTWMDLYRINPKYIVANDPLKTYYKFIEDNIDPQPFRRFTLGPRGGMVVTNNP